MAARLAVLMAVLVAPLAMAAPLFAPDSSPSSQFETTRLEQMRAHSTSFRNATIVKINGAVFEQTSTELTLDGVKYTFTGAKTVNRYGAESWIGTSPTGATLSLLRSNGGISGQIAAGSKAYAIRSLGARAALITLGGAK